MIKTASIAGNRHIENLKEKLSHSGLTELDYVIIAHSDNRMVNHLKKAFVEKAVVVLPIPQSSWTMEDEPMDELLDWILHNLSVKGVLLVGHSQGGTPADSVQVCASGRADSWELAPRRTSSLVDRVRQGEALVRQAEKHFLQQLDCLKQMPPVESQMLNPGLLVEGLFYRAESGLFCQYDSSTNRFRALINN